ncbi:dihydrofolate reductase isoform X1 [Macrobrachium rosenbergii]|uniref:dihydrofolate reductase isoform X1 n=1 Tax=Macrobrachium rosenbergii TaxID=79674 RepID=UPI0034D41671
MSPKLNIIVAACENNGIGKNGELPWKLREEMKYFSRITKTTSDPKKKNVVVMGRKTWESIPSKFRPLPGRLNVILSSQPKEYFGDTNGSIICQSFEAALEEACSQDDKLETIWVIGGSSLYEMALTSEKLHRVYVTRILATIACDTFLPPLDLEKFKLVNDPAVPQEPQEESGLKYRYEVYEKSKDC